MFEIPNCYQTQTVSSLPHSAVHASTVYKLQFYLAIILMICVKDD